MKHITTLTISSLVIEEATQAAALVASKRLKGKSYREKADAEEKGKKTAQKPPEEANMKVQGKPKVEGKPEVKPNGKAIEQVSKPNGRKGLIMEVVIPLIRKTSSSKSDRSSAPASSAPEDEITDVEERMTRKRKRRAAVMKVDLSGLDDSDDEVVSAAPSTTSSVKSSRAVTGVSKKRRIVKRGSPSSDYQGSSSEDEDEYGASSPDISEASDLGENEDENEDDKSPQRGKGKARAKAFAKPLPKVKGRSMTSDTEGAETESAMDLDSEPSEKPTKKKAVKRKDDAEKAAKKSKRADSDPWKLGSRAVQSEWADMQAPPFEMFHFARVVVDEYTYLDGKVHALVTKLSAERQWVLSGTPPIHDFGALKTIAAFLNIHLGVDDDGEGQSAEVKKRKREQTGTAQFAYVLSFDSQLTF